MLTIDYTNVLFLWLLRHIPILVINLQIPGMGLAHGAGPRVPLPRFFSGVWSVEPDLSMFSPHLCRCQGAGAAGFV